MAGFQDLMIMLAKVMTPDDLIEKLETSIKEYKANKNAESLRGVTFHCNLLIVNTLPADSKELIKDFEEFDDARQAMDAIKEAEKLAKG
jgi:hypothetical protein